MPIFRFKQTVNGKQTSDAVILGNGITRQEALRISQDGAPWATITEKDDDAKQQKSSYCAECGGVCNGGH